MKRKSSGGSSTIRIRSIPTDRQSADVEVVQYKVSFEPIENDPAERKLAPEQRSRIRQLSQEFHDSNPAQMVERLEAMRDEFPQVRLLWNHLDCAYTEAGRKRDADRLTEETFRRFPDYLFAMMNYALMRLQQGFPGEVPTILGGRFTLHELQKGRTTFHVTEVVAFSGVMALYHLSKGEREFAANHLDIMEQLDPENPLTKMVRSRMRGSLFQRLWPGSGR